MDYREKMVAALTAYDRRQSSRKGYNPYALAGYLGRIEEIAADIEAGADPRKAICAGFCDRVCAAALKACGLPAYTRDAAMASGIVYRPVTRD